MYDFNYTSLILCPSAQFGWTHVTLLIVVTQSHLIIHNLFEGMIWYVKGSLSNSLNLIKIQLFCTLMQISIHLPCKLFFV